MKNGRGDTRRVIKYLETFRKNKSGKCLILNEMMLGTYLVYVNYIS